MITYQDILKYEYDMNVFVFPQEIFGINIDELVKYNRKCYEEMLKLNYEYGSDTEICSFDVALNSYYEHCNSSQLIPDYFFLELIRTMIIDLESIHFSVMFSNQLASFEVDYVNHYIIFFNNLYCKAHNDVTKHNVLCFVTNLFVNGNKFKFDKLYNDSLLTQNNLDILNRLRNNSYSDY